MQAVILCGGRGERLMPMTACTPAGLLRILGKPVISYAIEQLKKAGFTQVTLALGYLGNQVIAEYDSKEFADMQIYYTSTNQDGTAPALQYAVKSDEDILVIEANCVFDFDLKSVIEYHNKKKSIATFVTKRDSETYKYTCFSADDNNQINGVAHNPSYEDTQSVHAFTGVYILSSNVFESYDFNKSGDVIEDILPNMISDGISICNYNTIDFWHKILDAEGFIKCQTDILKGKGSYEIEAQNLGGGIYSKTQSNFNGVSIVPPVYIGENVTIESGAIIDSYTVIDDNSIIEKRCRISSSYIGIDSHISARCELTSCVVSKGAILKSSAVCGEYCVIGEKSQIGEGARLVDGIKIWAGKEVKSNTVLDENLKVGLGKSACIDDNCSCDFGSSITAPSDTVKFGMAVGSCFKIGDAIIVGWSGKDSARALADAFKAGLVSCGVRVFDLGKSNTQQVMYAVNRVSAKIGCYISVDYAENIKLMDVGGLPLKRGLEFKIEQSYNSGNFRALPFHDYGDISDMNGVAMLYESFVANYLPERFTGVNVEIRTSSKPTAKIADRLFHTRNDIDSERIVFHISNDGSACSAYTDKTGYVFHERLIILAMKILYQRQIEVALPYSFPTTADTLAEHENGRLYRYFNCSNDNSDDDAREIAKRPDNFFVRDGLVLSAMISGYLSENKISLADAIKDIPKFYTTQRYVSMTLTPAEIMDKFAVSSGGRNEGVVMKNNESRAIIRPLKNGDGLMIFAESFKTEAASALCDEIQIRIKQEENSNR